jgi:hypothetical protein
VIVICYSKSGVVNSSSALHYSLWLASGPGREYDKSRAIVVWLEIGGDDNLMRQ